LRDETAFFADQKGRSITISTATALALGCLIVLVYAFFVVKPTTVVNYVISQSTIYLKSKTGECYITFSVSNTGTVDFVIEAVVLDKDVIKLPVEGMLGETTVKLGGRASLRVPLPRKYEVGSVVNVFLQTNPPFLEAQKFVVAPTPVEELS